MSLTSSYESLKIPLSQKLELFLGAILREGENGVWFIKKNYHYLENGMKIMNKSSPCLANYVWFTNKIHYYSDQQLYPTISNCL